MLCASVGGRDGPLGILKLSGCAPGTFGPQELAIVQNFIEMEPHRDLRDELLRRILDESVGRGLEDVKAGRVRPADEVFDELRRELAKPRREPARWQKIAR